MKPFVFRPLCLFALGVVFLLSSCNDDPAPPFWDYDTTVKIFTEAQLIESELALQKHDVNKDSISAAYYEYLFQKYHTNRTEFDSVLKFYAQHPVKLDSLYADIITRLTLLQSQQQTENK